MASNRYVLTGVNITILSRSFQLNYMFRTFCSDIKSSVTSVGPTELLQELLDVFSFTGIHLSLHSHHLKRKFWLPKRKINNSDTECSEAIFSEQLYLL